MAAIMFQLRIYTLRYAEAAIAHRRSTEQGRCQRVTRTNDPTNSEAQGPEAAPAKPFWLPLTRTTFCTSRYKHWDTCGFATLARLLALPRRCRTVMTPL